MNETKEEIETMTINYDKVYAEAERIAKERGHNPDLTDLDAIVEDAADLAKSQASTEDVLRILDTLIK
jgi:hypothetical protein